MALYFSRRLARRYMSWSTWKEVGGRLLDWAINRPLACSSRHQHHYRQNRLCRSNDVAAGWNPARSGRRPTFPRLSTRRRRNLSPAPVQKADLNGYFILPSRIKDTLIHGISLDAKLNESRMYQMFSNRPEMIWCYSNFARKHHKTVFHPSSFWFGYPKFFDKTKNWRRRKNSREPSFLYYMRKITPKGRAL